MRGIWSILSHEARYSGDFHARLPLAPRKFQPRLRDRVPPCVGSQRILWRGNPWYLASYREKGEKMVFQK